MMLWVGERAAIGFFCSNLHEQSAPGRSRMRKQRRRAGCWTRPATGTCGSGRARRSPTSTATRGRLRMSAAAQATQSGREVRPGTLARGRPAGAARRRLPGAVGSLDGDPPTPVPGVVGGRPRARRPRPHRADLTHRVPGLREPARQPRADRRGDARAAADPRHVRGGDPRGAARQAHQALGDGPDTELAKRRRDARQLAVDRRLLEEPRMEANGVRDFPRAPDAGSSSAARSAPPRSR